MALRGHVSTYGTLSLFTVNSSLSRAHNRLKNAPPPFSLLTPPFRQTVEDPMPSGLFANVSIYWISLVPTRRGLPSSTDVPHTNTSRQRYEATQNIAPINILQLIDPTLEASSVTIARTRGGDEKKIAVLDRPQKKKKMTHTDPEEGTGGDKYPRAEYTYPL